ncbi:MAG: radical SAM protein [Firmicutes bacterium]|nr:radical SAM protein [Bacillota bacterium]
MNVSKFEETKLPIVEIFSSISGEGISNGEIVSFVRVAGCNLRCSYCDTQYSYDEHSNDNIYLSPNEIVKKLNKLGCKKIICTGGEPLENDKAKRYLPIYLSTKGFSVRIETNGSVPLYTKEEINKFTKEKELININYTLDIKSPSSKMSEYNIFKENFLKLRDKDEIKFVVGSKNDLKYAMEVINSYSKKLSKNSVVINFSPVFKQIKVDEIIEFLKEKNKYFEKNNLLVRLSLQIHKYIWSPETRGV